jgi:WD40 repeat protein
MQRLPVTTPRSTPESTPTSTLTTPLPTTTLPVKTIHPEKLDQVRLLHQLWLVVATGAGVDPYEMDISTVAASADGRLLAVGGCSRPLEADLRSGNLFCNSADSESAEGVPFLLILDIGTEEILDRIPENETNTVIADLAFTPDSTKLIYAVHPGKFVEWEIDTGQPASLLWEGETSSPQIAISPDGRWIALKPSDEVFILDTASREVIAQLPAYFRPQFSMDNTRLAVYHDSQFVVYATDTWSEVVRFGLPCDCVYALSPALTQLATSERTQAEGALITVWDTSTGMPVQSLQASRGITAFLAFAPDGRMLWRADQRGELVAWETAQWTLLAEIIGGITPIFNLHDFRFLSGGRYYVLLSDLHLGLYGVP